MKIETKTITFKLQKKEFDAINQVYDAMSMIQEIFDDSTLLMSTETGECIKVSELARMKGILGGLASEYEWEIQ